MENFAAGIKVYNPPGIKLRGTNPKFAKLTYSLLIGVRLSAGII